MDLPQGRRIINVAPTSSTIVPGRSARPGDSGFDQGFGLGKGGTGLVRSTT